VLAAETTPSASSDGAPSRIESFGPLGVTIGPYPVSKTSAVSAAQPTGSVAPAGASSASSSLNAAPSSPAAPSGAARGGGSHASSTPAASSNTEEGLESSYSTTVAGKQYSGLVGESAGEYTAMVSSPPGIEASGSSEQAAEENLDARIDELV